MDSFVQLSEEVVNRILKEIKYGKYSGLLKLPPEVRMAEEMGVSRSVIRDSLSVLEQEGFVVRKHGVGTIINKHVLNVVTRIDLEKEFMGTISDAGYTPDVAFAKAQIVKSDKNLAEKLEISENSSLLEIEKLVTADGRPAIYCVDYIPVNLIKKENYMSEDFKKPVFDFLDRFCDIDIYMDLTEVKGIGCDDYISKMLDTPKGEAITFMDEVAYTEKGLPAMYSKEYYANGIVQHIVLRKKIK
jgi:GntR family transcriptional regulator